MSFGAEFTGSFVVRVGAAPSGESLPGPVCPVPPVAAGRGRPPPRGPDRHPAAPSTAPPT